MPALGASQPINYQFLDYSGERQSLTPGLFVGEVTAVSLPGLLTDLAALEAALDAVTLGARSRNTLSLVNYITNTRPTDKDAQVETQMIVNYIGDTTEKPFSFRIPTVDYTAFNYADPPAGDSVIISGAGASAATTALVTALEDVLRSPDDDSETITVTGMRVVR